jgi:TolB-like protein/tetratricopeptide (TPR) repeat protein
MPEEPVSDLKFDIGHVLLIDTVGYSKLLINQQREQLRALNEIVRNTAQFRASEARGMLVRLPTGDGMALIFRDTVEAPVRCALEISAAIKIYPEINLRMGIHSGPVSDVTDVNERANIAGAGIDLAQRVMDCGDAGHILLSKHIADDLAPYPHWNPYLHDLGECEVKHGRKIFVVNFYTAELGNPQLPEKLKKAQAQQATVAVAGRPSGVVRPKTMIVGFAACVFGAAAIALIYFSLREGRPSARIEKSVAVLPFENLSEEKGNAYFAEGIQEEILMRLAKIGDLKVISRTSTQRFKSSPDNLSEIAKQLRVANILEGSVQRAGDRVRVNVQLINAATEGHLWVETFDRQLTDVFAIESEVARTIADTLQAKLTGPERNAIVARPTEDTEAYQLYLKGRYFWNKRTVNDLKTAITYFQQASDKDSRFALAYAGLADAYVVLPTYAAAAPQEAYPKARAAAQAALQLDNTLAEAHASLAMVLLHYDFDHSRALAEFKRAIELNPNYATAHSWLGVQLYSALGRFDESIAEARRALELDPFSLIINAELGRAYLYPRRFDESIDQLRKTIELDSNFYIAHWDLGETLEAKGLMDAAIAEYKKAQELTGTGNPNVAGFLGHAYAMQGQREEALKMLAQLKDEATRRYVSPYSFAIVNLGLGDKEGAIRWLERDFDVRDGIYIGLVKVNPVLDPLRGDPRFEALVQKVFAPKQ